jgi:hypothetical protein
MTGKVATALQYAAGAALGLLIDIAVVLVVLYGTTPTRRGHSTQNVRRCKSPRRGIRFNPDCLAHAERNAGHGERAISVGFTGYSSKPIRLGVLRREVERLLNLAGAHSEKSLPRMRFFDG